MARTGPGHADQIGRSARSPQIGQVAVRDLAVGPCDAGLPHRRFVPDDVLRYGKRTEWPIRGMAANGFAQDK